MAHIASATPLVSEADLVEEGLKKPLLAGFGATKAKSPKTKKQRKIPAKKPTKTQKKKKKASTTAKAVSAGRRFKSLNKKKSILPWA